VLVYKQYVTISDPAKMELTNLPFQKGQRVEVVMIAEDDDKLARIDELRALFKKTQTLPQVQAISEDMIADEIEEYRAGR
jgi:inorganic pyrophosphatase